MSIKPTYRMSTLRMLRTMVRIADSYAVYPSTDMPNRCVHSIFECVRCTFEQALLGQNYPNSYINPHPNPKT